MKKTSIKTASVLAFERKLATSDALMFAGNWKDIYVENKWQPITIQEKSVRGTISNRLKNLRSDDPAILDAQIDNANLQTIDIAALPFNTDTLKISFTLRVLGDVFKPSVCNDQNYQAILSQKVNEYIKEREFSVLAARYAENIANARFVWRNRVGAEKVEVHISSLGADGKFESDTFSLREFSSPNKITKLAKLIQNGLLNKQYTFFKVDAYILLGEGQEVFPSQELTLSNERDNRKSKILYCLNGQAAIHSQKIGNALRTIDTWYIGAEELGPIAIEPYGAVTTRGKAYRQPKDDQDFYTLLDGWIIKDKVPELDQQHYVIANLIRGGVFGESAKNKEE